MAKYHAASAIDAVSKEIPAVAAKHFFGHRHERQHLLECVRESTVPVGAAPCSKGGELGNLVQLMMENECTPWNAISHARSCCFQQVEYGFRDVV